MRILGLDIATHTGWCSMDLDPRGFTWTGTYALATPAEVTNWRKHNLDRRCDPRVVRLFKWVQDEAERHDIVIFEDVEFCQTSLQCQLWSALRSAVWCACPAEKLECLPVKKLKMFATGNGNAEKQEMAEALAAKFPQRFQVDTRLKKRHILWDHIRAQYGNFGYGEAAMTSDAVDAFWLAQWARENIKR